MINPLTLFKLYFLASSDISKFSTGAKMGDWKTLAWWEHALAALAGQAPTVAALILGASNPVTIAISAACAIGTGIYTLAHAQVGAAIMLQAASDTTAAAAKIDWAHPNAQAGIQAAQAIADSLSKIVAGLPQSAPAAAAPAAPSEVKP